MLRGLVHRWRIERLRYAPGAAGIEHQRRSPIEDAIAVTAHPRREACMKSLRRQLGSEHRYRQRLEMEVDGIAELVGRDLAGKIDLCNLSQGMRTTGMCFGSSGSEKICSMPAPSEKIALRFG